MKLPTRAIRNFSVGAVALSLFSTMAQADTPDGGTPSAASPPIPITILASSPKTAPGLIFLTYSAGTPAKRSRRQLSSQQAKSAPGRCAGRA